jgi:hypothetical protein
VHHSDESVMGAAEGWHSDVALKAWKERVGQEDEWAAGQQHCHSRPVHPEVGFCLVWFFGWNFLDARGLARGAAGQALSSKIQEYGKVYLWQSPGRGESLWAGVQATLAVIVCFFVSLEVLSGWKQAPWVLVGCLILRLNPGPRLG